MTKLLEWLAGGFTFLGIWSALLFNTSQYNVTEGQRIIIKFLPVIAVILFGLYAASVVMWRVFTFNNCEEAAVELQKQIIEAKKELTSKGFTFDT